MSGRHTAAHPLADTAVGHELNEPNSTPMTHAPGGEPQVRFLVTDDGDNGGATLDAQARTEGPSPTNDDEKAQPIAASAKERTLMQRVRSAVKADLAWIPAKLNWADLKPVIRSAVAAWLSLVLILIPRTEAAIGQASSCRWSTLSRSSTPGKLLHSGRYASEALVIIVFLTMPYG